MSGQTPLFPPAVKTAIPLRRGSQSEIFAPPSPGCFNPWRPWEATAGQSSEIPCGGWLPSLPRHLALVEDRPEKGAGRAANPLLCDLFDTCANRLGARLLSPRTRIPKLQPPKPSPNETGGSRPPQQEVRRPFHKVTPPSRLPTKARTPEELSPLVERREVEGTDRRRARGE